MSYPVREESDKPLKGRLVYFFGSPVKCGVITEVVHPSGTVTPEGRIRIFAKVKVKYLKGGVVEEVGTECLNDYEMLVLDHQKKLSTHLAKLQQLQQLRGELQ
jgi:hypothetical protein